MEVDVEFPWRIGLFVGLLAVACEGGTGTDKASTGDDDDTVGDDDDDITGDDDDDDIEWDGDCDQGFSACGGDAVGEWQVFGVCTVDLSQLGCADATVVILEDRSSGTVSLTAAGTYDRQFNLDVDAEVTVPKDCIAPLTNCDLLVTASLGILDACTDEGDDCLCTGTFSDVDSAAGTWSSEGDELVFDGNERYEYCLSGDHASVRDSDGVRSYWAR